MSIVLGYEKSAGAEHALSEAIKIAKRFDEQLVLVYGSSPPGGLGEEYRAMETAIEALGRSMLDPALAKAEAEGVRAVIELIDARPVDALLQAAETHDATVIVVGTWGESPMRGAILGSTPHKLLHLSKRPVLCVPTPH